MSALKSRVKVISSFVTPVLLLLGLQIIVPSAASASQFSISAGTSIGSPDIETVGQPFVGYTLTPDSTPPFPVLYDITPSLPAGLSFGGGTGTITGTPLTTLAETSFTITDRGSAGLPTVTYWLQISAATTPAFTLSSSSETATAGSPIAGYTINSTGDAITSYSISPAVSNGLIFNTGTGILSGSPSAAAGVVTYTITAHDAAANTAVQTYAITVNAGAAHTVTFDVNGSGGGVMAPQISSGAANLTANAFTRAGSTFTGWNTAANGSGTSYPDGASFPFTADTTLYAQWVVNAGGATTTIYHAQEDYFGALAATSVSPGEPITIEIFGSFPQPLTDVQVNDVSIPASAFNRISNSEYSISLPAQKASQSLKIQLFDNEVKLMDPQFITVESTPADPLLIVGGSSITLSAVEGSAFLHQVPSTGGTGTVTFGLTAGILPNGLSLTPAGLISGTPTDSGSTFTVTATDSVGVTSSQTIDIVATIPPIVFKSSTETINQDIESDLSYVPSFSGGLAPFTYQYSNLPSSSDLISSGFAISSSSQSALDSQSFTVTLTVQDSAGQSATHTINLNFYSPLTITTPLSGISLNGIVGRSFSSAVRSVGGIAPIDYKINFGDGSSIKDITSSNGAFSYLPTQPGTYDWKITATDSSGAPAVTNIIKYVVAARKWVKSEPFGKTICKICSFATSSDGSHLVAGFYGGDIYTSTDFGATWLDHFAVKSEADPVKKSWYPLTRRRWISVASSDDGSHLVGAVYLGQIYTSDDYGKNWVSRSPVSKSKNWVSIASNHDGSVLAAALKGGDIFTSTDFGVTWKDQTGSGHKNWESLTMDSSGQRLVAAVYAGGIWTSSDGGRSWTDQAKAGNRAWYLLKSSGDGSVIVASEIKGNGTFYISRDYGVNWTPKVIQAKSDITSVTVSNSGKYLMASGINSLVYLSSDSGKTWLIAFDVSKSTYLDTAISAAGEIFVTTDLYGHLWTY